MKQEITEQFVDVSDRDELLDDPERIAAYRALGLAEVGRRANERIRGRCAVGLAMVGRPPSIYQPAVRVVYASGRGTEKGRVQVTERD
jgi:hypothetical protein